MSWAGDPMIPPDKTSICNQVVVCLGKKASWGNQSLGESPTNTTSDQFVSLRIIPLYIKLCKGGTREPENMANLY